MKILQKTLFRTITIAVITSFSIVWAETDTQNLDISIIIQPACTLDSVGAVSANHATGTSGAQTSSGQVQVTCNAGQVFTIAMSAGMNASSFQRRVHNGTNHIDYNLLKQSNSNVWGTAGTTADTTMNGAGAGIADQDGTGTGSPQIYGYEVSYNLLGTEVAGTYTDTVLVTLEF
ncbi:Csu type fimbrial protein [Candidatus Venteria ishoeyi]|uniref:Spore coat protein U/FanG domain-containing protein n=1 Tax=Candidatus Venteria ishoeyi TaxID=1899563 RepID=A0A1H6F7H2_9GAMM|nr:spore coat protein U domain-containing protein [Candidatus Venteria ishoeyi]SEH05016.1 Uncharacterised protein [Candidatus Venteria ishoeyi]